MAILHFINSKKTQTASGMLFVLRYTMQDKKTVADDGKKYVTGINCTPQSAYTEFNNTKRLYGKTDKRLYYHFVQSFSVDENISPQTAHEIALRFAEEAEKLQGFEIVVSTHCDRDHIHSHFVMNSLNADTGKKFHISENEVEMLMRISDNICREYGLSVIEPKPVTERAKPMSDREYRSAESGQSWKIRLEAVICNAMQIAPSKEHFIMLMEAEGYSVKWTDTRKNITYTTPDGKACRDSKLHYKKFLKESMENEFCYRAQITAGFYSRDAKENHRRRKGLSLRGGDRDELESYDRYSENTDRIASGYSEHPVYTYDRGEAERVYGRQADNADGVCREVSDGDGYIEEESYGEYKSDDNGYQETGWEYERELFAESLYYSQSSGGEIGETLGPTVLDVNDTFRGTHSVGIDTAYLIGDLGNIIDEDAPVEDCTTMHLPTEHKKNHGPVMGGM